MSSMTQQRTCWLNLKWNNNNKYTQRFCYPKMYGTKLYGITQKHHGFRILPFMQKRSRIVHIFKCNPTKTFELLFLYALSFSYWVFKQVWLAIYDDHNTVCDKIENFTNGLKKKMFQNWGAASSLLTTSKCF